MWTQKEIKLNLNTDDDSSNYCDKIISTENIVASAPNYREKILMASKLWSNTLTARTQKYLLISQKSERNIIWVELLEKKVADVKTSMLEKKNNFTYEDLEESRLHLKWTFIPFCR